MRHKILGMDPAARVPRWLAVAGVAAEPIALILLFLLALSPRWEATFPGDAVYYVDADCYSRMLRARELWEGGIHSIAFQRTENWPDGVHTHATMPLDLLIVGLGRVFQPWATDPLAVAGAWVSPILGACTLIMLWAWTRRERFRWFGWGIAAISPAWAHGFALGRPDHQSLQVFLLTLALLAEWRIWGAGEAGKVGLSRVDRGWWRDPALISGVAWGLALWTSLYEPLVFLVLTLSLRGVVLGWGALRPRVLRGMAATGIILAAALVVDGMRFQPLPTETLTFFANWSRLIGELRSSGWLDFEILAIAGFLPLLFVGLLIWQFVRGGGRAFAAFALFLAVSFGLTLWQRRWEYFLVMVVALVAPTAMRSFRHAWKAWLVFLVASAPVFVCWIGIVHSSAAVRALHAEQRKEDRLLREAGQALISNDMTPILAPWWLSPAFAWWSGQPTVGGSSHQSLPGIVASCRFYLSEPGRSALALAEQRGVVFVVGYEPERVVVTSETILGIRAPVQNMATRLYRTGVPVPPGLEKVFQNEFFRIYEVRSIR